MGLLQRHWNFFRWTVAHAAAAELVRFLLIAYEVCRDTLHLVVQ